MSISLLEVLENAGFDISNNISDAQWLLGKAEEFNELYEIAENLEEDYNDYQDYVDEAEEAGETDIPSFEKWRSEK